MCCNVKVLCVQLFTQSVGGPDPRVLQLSGAVRSGSLGSGFLCPLVWTLSTLCPRVWGPSSCESPVSFLKKSQASTEWTRFFQQLQDVIWNTFWHFFEKYPLCDWQILKGEVRAGKLDCQAHQQICQSAGITAYPTVRFYPYLGMRRVRTDTPRQTPTFSQWSLNSSFIPVVLALNKPYTPWYSTSLL